MIAPTQLLRPLRTGFLPAVVATFGASLGFAGLKMLLVGELALAFDLATHDPLPSAWLEELVQRCARQDNIKEAITQGLAAVITLGVIIGYLINAPLAGAWSCRRLFSVSALGVGAGSLAVLVVNPWVAMLCVGIFYGAACAARGKSVPLIAKAGGLSNTFVSGVVNASMTIGLLLGTLLGFTLYEYIKGDEPELLRHAIIAGFLALALGAGLLVRPPEPPRASFAAGWSSLFSGTLGFFARHWPLLVGGGLAWGIISAASLAVLVDAVQRLHLKESVAPTLALWAAGGAIAGNLISHRWKGRLQVALMLALMGAVIFAYPLLATGYLSASLLCVLTGGLFAAGSNVLDARFLREAAQEGHAGHGATLMSLTHSLAIFVVGSGLAIALLLDWLAPATQFPILGAGSLLTAVAACFAKLSVEARPTHDGHQD